MSPPSGPPLPAGRCLLLLMSPTAVNGGGIRAFGAWPYTGWRRKVRAIVLICQVLIQPGVDDEGKRSGMTLVGLCGRQHQAGEGKGGNNIEGSYRGREGRGGGGHGGKKGKRFVNSLSAKSILAGEKLVATYSIST
jgi:hypothetical protein